MEVLVNQCSAIHHEVDFQPPLSWTRSAAQCHATRVGNSSCWHLSALDGLVTSAPGCDGVERSNWSGLRFVIVADNDWFSHSPIRVGLPAMWAKEDVVTKLSGMAKGRHHGAKGTPGFGRHYQLVSKTELKKSVQLISGKCHKMENQVRTVRHREKPKVNV